jgi:hypothetical protein
MTALLLVACSNEPSNIDVRNSIQASINRDISNVTQRKILGLDLGVALGIADIKINEIEKIDCVNLSKKIVSCDVLVDYEIINHPGGLAELLGGVPRYRKVSTYRFVKTANGWDVADFQIQ